MQSAMSCSGIYCTSTSSFPKNPNVAFPSPAYKSYWHMTRTTLTELPLLTALERTFLGYLKTSLSLSFLGVIIAQLFRLEHTINPDPIISFYAAGVPLASVCNAAALVVSLLGAYRFWRQQNALTRGKIQAGGWDLLAVGILITLVGFSLLGSFTARYPD